MTREAILEGILFAMGGAVERAQLAEAMEISEGRTLRLSPNRLYTLSLNWTKALSGLMGSPLSARWMAERIW